MRLSEVVQILARRLDVRPGRVSAIASRLQHAGLLPITEGSRRYPPEIEIGHAATLLLAVIGDRGLGCVPDTASAVGDYRSQDGGRLADALLAVLRGQAQPGDLIVRDGGASATFNGHHLVFGNPAEDGNARFVTSATLAAIVAELSGASPAHADAVAAITRIRNY